jgi:hypothetical protein
MTNYGLRLERNMQGIWAAIIRDRGKEQLQNIIGKFSNTFTFRYPGTDVGCYVWRHSAESLGLSDLRTTSWWTRTEGVLDGPDISNVTADVVPTTAPDTLVRLLKVHTDNSAFPSEKTRESFKFHGIESPEELAEMRKCLLCMNPSVHFAMKVAASEANLMGYSKPTTLFFGVCEDHSDIEKNEGRQKEADVTLFKNYAVAMKGIQ